jgi:hypothetical protein
MIAGRGKGRPVFLLFRQLATHRCHINGWLAPESLAPVLDWTAGAVLARTPEAAV